MKSRKNALVLTVAAICATLCFAALALRQRQQVVALSPFDVASDGTLPVLGQVPDFTLVDAMGRVFNAESLDNRIWVADFIFTHCAGPCPVMSTNMAGLQERFRDEDALRFVSVSVDPETDTPEVLAEYGKRYEADAEKWHFLTGPAEDIHRLAVKGFMVGSVDEPLFHSTRFILVDGERRIRGYYHGTSDESVEDLGRDIEALLSESE